MPNVDPARTRTRVLRIWSGVSASVLLTGLALVILGQFGALLPAVGGLAVVMLCAEAFARGHLVQFVAGLLAVARRGRSGGAGYLGGPGALAIGYRRPPHPGRRRPVVRQHPRLLHQALNREPCQGAGGCLLACAVIAISPVAAAWLQFAECGTDVPEPQCRGARYSPQPARGSAARGMSSYVMGAMLVVSGGRFMWPATSSHAPVVRRREEIPERLPDLGAYRRPGDDHADHGYRRVGMSAGPGEADRYPGGL